jgi:hypothetical protein
MRYNSKILAHLAGLAVVASAWAADRVIVEDWRSYLVGARAIPAEWKEQTWGKGGYDFEIVSDNGQAVLHLRSDRDSSTITPISKILSISMRRVFSSGGGRSVRFLLVAMPAGKRPTTRPPKFT